VPHSASLADLGWSAHFLSQLDLDELSLTPARVAAVHRDRLELISAGGPFLLEPGRDAPTGDFAVGDWLLTRDGGLVRRLARRSLLSRRAAGTGAGTQLIAANVDTLFVVTACNADFNPARIERYLALAAEAGTEAVVVLTRADLADPADFVRRAEALARGLIAVPLDARDPAAAVALHPWCGRGRTVALVGSSGVGKTTLANTLSGGSDPTAPIREDDAKGRHTTTHRALIPLAGGGWLIDTPGMRALRLADAAEGIDTVFGEIAGLAAACRFGDCTHGTEPGCAVREAVSAGVLDAERLLRWQKLRREEAVNSETLAQSRARHRAFGRQVRRALALKDDLSGRRG
jgi:ribosome biogenesis GTPase / thiamine phosphate phosphatase